MKTMTVYDHYATAAAHFQKIIPEAKKYYSEQVLRLETEVSPISYKSERRCRP